MCLFIFLRCVCVCVFVCQSNINHKYGFFNVYFGLVHHPLSIYVCGKESRRGGMCVCVEWRGAKKCRELDSPTVRFIKMVSSTFSKSQGKSLPGLPFQYYILKYLWYLWISETWKERNRFSVFFLIFVFYDAGELQISLYKRDQF